MGGPGRPKPAALIHPERITSAFSISRFTAVLSLTGALKVTASVRSAAAPSTRRSWSALASPPRSRPTARPHPHPATAREAVGKRRA